MTKRGTRAGRGVSAALVEQHADELFRLIAAGMTIKQACGSDAAHQKREVAAMLSMQPNYASLDAWALIVRGKSLARQKGEKVG